jgi:hypothetical protein
MEPEELLRAAASRWGSKPWEVEVGGSFEPSGGEAPLNFMKFFKVNREKEKRNSRKTAVSLKVSIRPWERLQCRFQET